MDINRLRYFCTAVQTENLRRASELLHISPPALSKAIKVFESEVGLRLVEQVGRGIIITDQGRRFYERASILLKQIENFKKHSEISKHESAVVKIGSFEVFTTYFMGPLFRNYFPDLRCELHEFIPGHLEQALILNSIDIGITYIPIPHPQVDHLKIGNIQMGLFSNKNDFLDLPFSEVPFVVPISPVEGAPTKIKGLDGWPDGHLPRLQKYKVMLMETALELCRQGIAVAYLPKFIVTLHNEQVKLKYRLNECKVPQKLPKNFLHQDVFIAKRKATPENDHIKRLAKVLRMICCQ